VVFLVVVRAAVGLEQAGEGQAGTTQVEQFGCHFGFDDASFGAHLNQR